MKRILIIGSGGAGKSTLARRLSKISGIPLIHLDRHYWRAGWHQTPKAEWIEDVAVLIASDQWIMDGNFDGSLDLRLSRADTVVFLDMPRYLCFYRVIKRRLSFRGTNRPDLADGCNEKLDLEFLWWLWRYPNSDRTDCEAKIARAGGHVTVIRLHSAAQVEQFVAEFAIAG